MPILKNNNTQIPHRNFRGRSYLDTYANRWTQKVESGKWEEVLNNPRSYVNRNKSYKSFSKLIDTLFLELQPKQILDIGCGTCDLWNILTKYSDEKNLYGIDLAKGMIDVSTNKYPKANFYLCDALDIQKNIDTKTQFEAIISRGVIINHMGKEYFSKILDNLQPYSSGIIVFDYVSKEWIDARPSGFRPSFPLYTSEDIAQLIKTTKFANKELKIYNQNDRDPIVVLK
jgi:2-polyprenyl-3-methyl-5-hydroxy-6-metoxy-1,4-benzoquinol methylase